MLTEVVDSNPHIDLLVSKVEETPLDIFLNLSEGDFLFIDTSHNLKTGNDVYHLYLKVLPLLNKGVVVHIHDIFIPYDYPRRWVEEERKIWNEQYLLHAFLLYNNAFEVMLPLHKMFQNDKALISRSLVGLEEGDPIGPSSFWIRRLQ